MEKKTPKLVVLITGASGGIGEALSRIFARQGFDLILVARREQLLGELKAELEEGSACRVFVIPMDLCVASAADALMRKIQDLDLTVDILVNNAGVGLYGLFAAADWASCERMLSLNIRTLTHLTYLCLAGMRQQGRGRILNVASTAAFQAGPFMSLYYASKAYVLHFSEGLSSELEGSGITVTALCPGPTTTGFQAEAKMHASGLMRLSFQSAEAVAEFGYKALMRGQVVAIPGWLNRLMAYSTRFLPRVVLRKVLKMIMASK